MLIFPLFVWMKKADDGNDMIIIDFAAHEGNTYSVSTKKTLVKS